MPNAINEMVGGGMEQELHTVQTKINTVGVLCKAASRSAISRALDIEILTPRSRACCQGTGIPSCFSELWEAGIVV